MRDHKGNIKKIKYTKMITTYFDYRGAVNFHNAKRHDGGTRHDISIE